MLAHYVRVLVQGSTQKELFKCPAVLRAFQLNSAVLGSSGMETPGNPCLLSHVCSKDTVLNIFMYLLSKNFIYGHVF